jgi:ABC-2 type transport system permease protein
MTAATIAAAETSTRGDFGRAVLAEWTKFRTVRSSFWTLLIAVAVTIGAGAAFMQASIDGYSGPPGQQATYAVREGWWFQGMQVSLLAVMILGVLVASSEYSTGTIRASLAAVPSRTRVLAAKIVSLAAVALLTGAVQAVGALLVSLPILADRSIDVPLTDPSVWRGVWMATLTVAGAALFGLAAGLLIRHTAGPIGAVVAVTWVVSALVHLLPAGWQDVIDALPATAMWAITQREGTISGATAALVFYGYVTALLTIAGVLFARRDA